MALSVHAMARCADNVLDARVVRLQSLLPAVGDVGRVGPPGRAGLEPRGGGGGARVVAAGPPGYLDAAGLVLREAGVAGGRGEGTGEAAGRGWSHRRGRLRANGAGRTGH